MTFFLTPLLGCGESVTKSWNSPEMNQVEKKWDAIWDEYKKTPHEQKGKKYGDKNSILHKILGTALKDNLSSEDVYHLANTCEVLAPNINDRSKFENIVLRYLAEVLVAEGDRQGLVKLLSTRAPNAICHEPIEFYVVYRGNKLKDPILIFLEAYTKCKSHDVRRALIASIRRGFAGHKIEGEDDKAFVKNAKKWYEEEKNNLVSNDKYAYKTLIIPWNAYEKHPELYEDFLLGAPGGNQPLFVKKK